MNDFIYFVLRIFQNIRECGILEREGSRNTKLPFAGKVTVSTHTHTVELEFKSLTSSSFLPTDNIYSLVQTRPQFKPQPTICFIPSFFQN